MTADFVPLTPEQIAAGLKELRAKPVHWLASRRAQEVIEIALRSAQHYAEEARRLREVIDQTTEAMGAMLANRGCSRSDCDCPECEASRRASELMPMLRALNPGSGHD